MAYVTEAGKATRVTATGVTVLTSGPANLIGIGVSAVTTAQLVQIFTQTAASITGAPIQGTMTMAANTFTRMPAAAPLGITYAVTNDDVDLTIYWNPAGGV